MQPTLRRPLAWGPRLLLAAWATGMPLVFAGESLATSLVPVEFPELVERSPVIVHATVLASTSRWTADRTRIVTDVRLQVIESLRGDPSEDILVTQLGGQVGALRMDVDGAAPFRVGEEVVLFLSDTSLGGGGARDTASPAGSGPPGAGSGFRLVGMSQGRFPVHTDPRTGEKWIQGSRGTGWGAPVTGSSAADPPVPSVGGDSGRVTSAAGAGFRIPLAGFLSDLRTRVHQLSLPKER